MNHSIDHDHCLGATESTHSFRARVLQDALAEGLAICSERRARQFDAVQPRPGDFLGRSTPEQRAERQERAAAIASAFRNRARLLREFGSPAWEGVDADVWDALVEAHAELSTAVGSSSVPKAAA